MAETTTARRWVTLICRVCGDPYWVERGTWAAFFLTCPKCQKTVDNPAPAPPPEPAPKR